MIFTILLTQQVQIIQITITTQSRSIVTPNAKPASLSIAPATTSTMNQGWRITEDVELCFMVLFSAYMIILADNNWAAVWHNKIIDKKFKNKEP